MKCDPVTLAELLARPGAKSLGMARESDHVAGGGKKVGRKTRPRHVKGVQNAEERRFAAEVLEVRRLAGEITSYRYEPVCFELSDRRISKCTLTLDWLAFHRGRIEAFDVKGGPTEGDAEIKMKWFVNKYHHIPLFTCRRRKGKWEIKRVGKDQGNYMGEVANGDPADMDMEDYDPDDMQYDWWLMRFMASELRKDADQ